MKNNQIDRSGGLTSGRLPFRENWLRASVLAALLSFGTVSAYADPFSFQWPANPDGIKEVTVSFDPELLTSEIWKDPNPDGGDDKDKQHSALILLDGDTHLGRTDVRWWNSSAPDQGSPYELTFKEGSNPIAGDEYAVVRVNAGKDSDNNFNALNIVWDFTEEKASYSPAIAVFRDATLSEKGAGEADRYIKNFVFESEVNVVTQNSTVSGTNVGDSSAMLGLSVVNKRSWMTFTKDTFLISDFTFETVTTGNGGNTLEGQYIAAGVVTGFGAHDSTVYDDIFQTDGSVLTADFKDLNSIRKYGLTEFQGRTVVSVTARPMENEPEQLHEVFGVFSNEGGTIDFQAGGDIVVKGRNNHHLVSAIAAASTLGVLDPLKEGTVKFRAGNGVNRIWGWSDSFAASDDDSTLIVGGGTELFEEVDGAKPVNKQFFDDLGKWFGKYLTDATGGQTTTSQTLRTAVIAANGATVEISDGASGWLDIRGDVVSGVLNGAGSKSNTFERDTGTIETASAGDTTDSVDPIVGTVTRSDVTISLTNAGSTLVGNVYERHRLVGEAVELLDSYDGATETFEAWAKDQYKQETQSLGGNIQLSLSNGATWYPTRSWGGWNFDILDKTFFTGEPGEMHVNTGYAKYDAADQYNLRVWNEKSSSYELTNYTLKDGTTIDDPTKLNDLDILTPGDESSTSLPTAPEKGEGYETVDNGVYHLTMKGGVLDLRYLRQDFDMSIAQDDLGTNVSETIDQGVKRFRIQELAGTGGTVNFYAENNENHDLLIIDQTKDGEASNLNLVLWNAEGATDHPLDVRADDPSTYIHIARVPENVTVTAEAYGPGRTTYTTYRVERDEKTAQGAYDESSWTWQQKEDWHSALDNLFITNGGENRTDMAVVGTTELGANLGYLMATTMETLRDRRGEARYNGTQADGLWIRYTHNRFGMDGFTAETDGFQLGYEAARAEEEGKLVHGVAFDVAEGDVEYDHVGGDSEANRYRLSAYRTWLGDNGVYYDVVGRIGWYDAETNLLYQRENSTRYDVAGKFDYWAAAASFEAGHRFENDSAWWIEPQLQVQYTHITDYDYRTSQDIRIEAEDTDSLIGRAGLRVGKVLSSDQGRRMSLWVGVDVLHEWLGDREGSMKGVDQTVRYEIAGDDTWYDAVFGLAWETGSDSRLWAVGKHDFGGEMEDTWTVNVGATWNF